jgi:hypothetical protein
VLDWRNLHNRNADQNKRMINHFMVPFELHLVGKLSLFMHFRFMTMSIIRYSQITLYEQSNNVVFIHNQNLRLQSNSRTFQIPKSPDNHLEKNNDYSQSVEVWPIDIPMILKLWIIGSDSDLSVMNHFLEISITHHFG